MLRVLLCLMLLSQLHAQEKKGVQSPEQKKLSSIIEKAGGGIRGIDEELDRLCEKINASRTSNGVVVKQDDADPVVLSEIGKKYKEFKEAVDKGSAAILAQAQVVLGEQGIGYKLTNVANYGDVITISPEGEHPLNLFAAFLKSIGVALNYDPKVLFNENASATFNPNTRTLNLSHNNLDGSIISKQNSVHELIHAFFDTLWEMGVESDMIGMIRAKNGVISQNYGGSYNEHFWIDEIAAYFENISSDSRAVVREFKKARTKLNAYFSAANLVIGEYIDNRILSGVDEAGKARLLKLKSEMYNLLLSFSISPRYSASRHQRIMAVVDELFADWHHETRDKFLDILQDIYNRDMSMEIAINSSSRLEPESVSRLTRPTRERLLLMGSRLETLSKIISRAEEVLTRMAEKLEGEYSTVQPGGRFDAQYQFTNGLVVGGQYITDSGRKIYYIDVSFMFDNIEYKTMMSDTYDTGGDLILSAKNKISRQLGLIAKFRDMAGQIDSMLKSNPIYSGREFLFNDELLALELIQGQVSQARELYRSNISISGYGWREVLNGYRRQDPLAVEPNVETKVVNSVQGVTFEIEGLSKRIKALNEFITGRFGTEHNKYETYPIYMGGAQGFALVSETAGVLIILEGKDGTINLDIRKLPQRVIDRLIYEQSNRKKAPFEILNYRNIPNPDGTLIGYLREYGNELGQYAVIATLSGTERNAMDEMLSETLPVEEIERLLKGGDLYEGYKRFTEQKDVRSLLSVYVGVDSSSDRYLAKNFFRVMIEELDANDGVFSDQTLSCISRDEVLDFLELNAPWEDASFLVASMKGLLKIENGKFDPLYTLRKAEVDKFRQELKLRTQIKGLMK